MTMNRSVRAVRNNNPMNVKLGDPWQGLMKLEKMTPEQAAETEFCVFESMRMGFRAAARVLISYRDKHGIRTIAGIVRRWAPPSENDTAAYAAAVVRMTGIEPDEILNLHDYATLFPIMKAMATVEAGGWLFDEKDLEAGLRLAGVEPPPAAIAQSRTVKTAAGAGAAAAGLGIIANAIEQLQPAIDAALDLHERWPYGAIAVLSAALIAIVVFRVDDYLRARR